MSSSLFTGVFSVTPTKRRRFFWAVWWTAPPEVDPFRAPDASNGGARTREQARELALAAAGLPCLEIPSRWANAWLRVVRGEPPWPKPRASSGSSSQARPPIVVGSRPWARGVLGVAASATVDEIQRAFRALALTRHPDHGGTDAGFIDLKRACDIALAAARSRQKRHG